MTDSQVNNFGVRLKIVRSSKNMTLEQFYGPVTAHLSNCSAIENGKRRIGKRLSKDIVNYHEINPDWLQTGEGNMLNLETAKKPELDSVPFFNVHLSDLSSDDRNIFSEPPEYYVNFRPFNDCDAYLPIYGDSMYPKYASGEIIAIKEIQNFDIIQWGEAYLIIGDDRANNLITVKQVYEHPDLKKLVLRSSNPNFKGDTIMEKALIKRLFIIKGKVTRNQL